MTIKKKQAGGFICRECQAIAKQWAGKCFNCGAWNTLEVMRSSSVTAQPATTGWVGDDSHAKPVWVKDVDITTLPRIATASPELDRVLGGGMVPGSVILMGGDPGVGKSTLLLQVLAELGQQHAVLYVSGEESLSQIARRAQRAKLNTDRLKLLTETACGAIFHHVHAEKAQIVVMDSIQTLYDEEVAASPGSVSQVRACALQAVRFAKQHQVTIFIVGHVTKEGHIAGPRVLEHMVDTVLYFEGERDGRYRIVRAVKNRFGAVNEIGIFAMTPSGIKDLKSPSAIFLSQSLSEISGRSVMTAWEGSRPILLEIQALIDDCQGSQPRRLAVGLESQRIAMILAVMNRHTGLMTHGCDVFINVVGGMKIIETAADLAVMMALVSSLKNQPLPADLMIIGEIGLAGEIRPIPNGMERVKEAIKHGFKKILLPAANAPKKETYPEVTWHAVDHVKQAVAIFFG